LPAAVVGATAHVDGHMLPLAGHYPMQTGRVQVGVRPDFAELTGNGIPVRVDRIDDLGRLRLARVRLGPYPMVATVGPGAVFDGSEARLHIDPARTHVYADDRLVAPL
ncbi:MAG: TOBE domain-containing protein, partial [Gemmatimonadaceae bacterium]|nr:TOBE domain-containing protein [Acetobacteraceae bacterium]